MPNDKLNKLKTSGEAAEKKSSSQSPDSPQEPCSREAAWVELELLDEDNKAITDETYVLVLPDSTERKGKTDVKGQVRVECIDPGTCKVIFPRRDSAWWEPLPEEEPPPVEPSPGIIQAELPAVAWLEIELVDDEGRPLAGEPYKIVPGDGSGPKEDFLDNEGFARIHGLSPGSSKVIFPRRDSAWWEPVPEEEPPPVESSPGIIQAELPAVAWLEIELVDDEGRPLAGEPYKIVPGDGSEPKEDFLDNEGFARIHGLSPGSCKVIFPRRDSACLEPLPAEEPPPVEP
jgi:hypothetical protein